MSEVTLLRLLLSRAHERQDESLLSLLATTAIAQNPAVWNLLLQRTPPAAAAEIAQDDLPTSAAGGWSLATAHALRCGIVAAVLRAHGALGTPTQPPQHTQSQTTTSAPLPDPGDAPVLMPSQSETVESSGVAVAPRPGMFTRVDLFALLEGVVAGGVDDAASVEARRLLRAMLNKQHEPVDLTALADALSAVVDDAVAAPFVPRAPSKPHHRSARPPSPVRDVSSVPLEAEVGVSACAGTRRSRSPSRGDRRSGASAAVECAPRLSLPGAGAAGSYAMPPPENATDADPDVAAALRLSDAVAAVGAASIGQTLTSFVRGIASDDATAAMSAAAAAAMMRSGDASRTAAAGGRASGGAAPRNPVPVAAALSAASAAHQNIFSRAAELRSNPASWLLVAAEAATAGAAGRQAVEEAAPPQTSGAPPPAPPEPTHRAATATAAAAADPMDALDAATDAAARDVFSAAPTTTRQRRHAFTQEEDDAIVEGLQRFTGPSRFTQILQLYQHVWVQGRTALQLSDHYRNHLRKKVIDRA